MQHKQSTLKLGAGIPSWPRKRCSMAWPQKCFYLILIASLASLAGCANPGSNQIVNAEPIDTILPLVHQSSEVLLASEDDLDTAQPVLASAFIDLDDPHGITPLGRALAEMFATGLVQADIDMLEVSVGGDPYVETPDGQRLLAPEVRRLAAVHNARGLLVGTYVRGLTSLYINVRLVRVRDNAVLGASSLAIPMNYNTRALLPAQW